MLLVVVCHSTRYLTPVCGAQGAAAVERLALICDPIFFALSGYFAIRPLKGSYGRYLSHKVKTVVVPLLVYATLAYAAFCVLGEQELGAAAYLGWVHQTMGAQYWFVPALIPCLMVAPLLHTLFSNLDKRQTKALLMVAISLSLWGLLGQVAETALPGEPAASAVGIASYLLPASTLFGTYLPFFCLGYLAGQVPGLFGKRAARAICGLGWALWPCVALLVMAGFEPHNPDYSWFVTTIAVMCLFARLQIKGRAAKRCAAWVARHSYGIYLLQAGVIRFVFGAATSRGLLDATAKMAGGLIAWVACLALSYLVSLVAAALLDGTVVRLAQAGYAKVEDALARRQ